MCRTSGAKAQALKCCKEQPPSPIHLCFQRHLRLIVFFSSPVLSTSLTGLSPFYKYVYKARRALNLRIFLSLFSIYRNSRLNLTYRRELRPEVCMLFSIYSCAEVVPGYQGSDSVFLSLSLKSFHVMYFMIE